MMWAAQLTLLIYGAVLLVGGGIGYAKGKSSKSLLGGLVGAALCGLSYGLLRWDPRWGLGLGLATALLGVVVFARRYRRTGSFLPAGLMLLASLVAAILLGVGLLRSL